MLATNYLEIGQQAVTALTRKLDAHKRTYLHDVRAWYLLERTEFECYEIEVCEDGDWIDGGWFPDPATVVRHEPRKVNINVRVSTSRPNVASQLRGVLRMLDIAMSRLTYWRRDAFEAGDNPCAAADAFDPGPVEPTPEVLEVDAEPEPSGPSKEDCEEWRRQRAGLQREYDSFRGSYSTGLLIDQLGKDKEHAQYQSRYYEQFVEDISAMIQRDNDRVADGGTPNESFAQDLRDDLAKYEAKRDEWIEKQQELDQSMTALRDKEVLGRTRMPEIQQEIAELDARLAECE